MRARPAAMRAVNRLVTPPAVVVFSLCVLGQLACGGDSGAAGDGAATVPDAAPIADGDADPIADSAAAAAQAGGAGASDGYSACSAPEALAALPDALYEVSGVALSRRHAGVFWLHNDSDPQPAVYAVNAAGDLLASVRIDASESDDLEDIAVGDCPAGDCLYVAAIGDNVHDRTDRGFYRFPEPDLNDAEVAGIEFFPIVYPTGPQDAEALFVLPGGDVHIISKGRQGPVTHYRYGEPTAPNVERVLEAIETMSPGIVQFPDMVTGAGALPDGSIVVVRTYAWLRFYGPREGRLVPLLDSTGVDLTPLDEGQGEGVDLGPDGLIVLASERGLDRDAAPLSALRCDIDRIRRE